MPTVFDDLPDVAPDAAPVASVNPFDDLPDLAPGHVAPPRPIPMANEIDPGHVPPPMPIPMASERGFDPREESFTETLLSPKRWVEAGGDVAAATGRGVVGLGEGVVGAANLLPSFDPERGVYFGGAGATLEHLTGYDPQTAKEEISRIESPSLKKARANVQKSEGFAGTVKAILQNPQTIPAGVAESLPSMMGGAAIARGAMAAAPALGALGASAFGEGAVTAAQQLEQARQAQPDRTLDLDEATVSVASGAATGLISLFGGKLAARLGLEDIDTLLAKNVLPARKSAVALRILGGAIQEGLLEEFPQSLQESIAQNLAAGKPWDSGVVRDGIEGALQGIAMGATSNIQRGPPSAGETAGELLGEAIKGSHLDLNVLNEVAVNRTLPPPRMPLREGERVEMGPEVGGVQGEGVNITTGPSRARVVRPAQPTGNVFEALPDVEPEETAFNVGEATPVLKNFLGRKFRTGDGFIGELKREGERFVLVAGNTIHELPASGPDATADDAGIAMLRKSATEPSRLQVSRKQAKLRQLANWARKFPAPPPSPPAPAPVAGQPVAKPAVQDLHPAHKALINAVLKNMALKGPSNAEILATIEQLPLTRRMLEAQITRMEAGGATAKETEFYYTALDRMEKYENRYLEGVTGKTYPRNREAGATQPPTPQPVSPAEGASNAGAAVPPVAPAVSVTTPVTEEPQAEPDKPLTKAEREQHSKDNKEFRALFDEWGVQLGFIQDPNMFYSRREPGGDTASIKHNIQRDKSRKAAFDSVIKYFGGDVQFKTPKTYAELLPKLKSAIEEFNRADSDLTGVPADVSTDFLPPESPSAIPKLRTGEKGTGDLLQGADAPFNLAGEKGVDVERIAREKAESERKRISAEEAAKKAQMNLPVIVEGEPIPVHTPTEVPVVEPPKPVAPETVSDWTSATAETPVETPVKTEPKSVGEKPPQIIELGAGVPLPKFANQKMTGLNRATTQHSAKLQKSFDEARRAQKEINKVISSPQRQAAASVWREADGDIGLLRDWEANAKQPWMRDAARIARTLTPAEIAVIQKTIAAFDVLARRGKKFDVLQSHQDNYIPHVWDVSSKLRGFGSGILKQKFKFAKARTFQTLFDGDQAGFKPKTIEIGKLLPAYIHEMNKVIADRQFVQDLSKQTASDGRPLVIPRGYGKPVEGDSGTAHLVFPRGVRELTDAEGKPIDQSDYKTMEGQPALQDWRWIDKDEKGNPIFLQSDLSLHPEALRRVNAMLGQSALRTWARDPTPGVSQLPKLAVRAIDTAQSAMKREMFGLLAPFHQVQEGTHAVGHLVNPFGGLEKVDLRNPKQMDAAQHGLMLLPDRASASSYLEGVGSKTSLVSRGLRKLSPVGRAIAEVTDQYQDYLFHQYIPALKFKTYEAMLGRNLKLYEKELKSGEMTEGDVKITTAQQANAAYGHLNYALLDRNPTIQHLIQLATLAPDFLEARGRFVGQGVKGLSSKVGREQTKAIAILAASQAGMAILISGLLGDDWDPEHPFEVIHKGRRYTLRSVPEDIFSLVKDTRQFAASRVNPLVVRGGVQYVTGLNYRGEKVNAMDTTGELLAGYIPITARQIPGLRSLTEYSRNAPTTPLEQLAGSLGLRISRYSPITETYKRAAEWMDKQNIPREKGSYPVSKYQQLRYALEDGDLDRAAGEYQELRKQMTPDQIGTGFQQSVNHAFTGSATDDRKFLASLKPHEKLLYQQALEVRKGLLNKFAAMKKQ